MNRSYEECLRVLKKINEKLMSSLDNAQEKKEQEQQDSSLCSPPKIFLDNTSKSSSGYDDSESFDDNAVEEQEEEDSTIHTCDTSATIESVAKTIPVNDLSSVQDFESWRRDTASDDEFYLLFHDNSLSNTSEESENCFVARHSLPLYPPSEEMKISNNDKFSIKSVRHTNQVVAKYVDDLHLNQSNIQCIYKSLLEIEDITCLSEYPALAQKNVKLNWTQKREYWIPIINIPKIEDICVPFMDELVLIPIESSMLAEAKPPKYSIDILFPHSHEYALDNSIRRRIATITKVTKTEVHFRFSMEERLTKIQRESLSSTKYDVLIRPRRLPVRYQHRALELLKTNDEVIKFLFPQLDALRALQYKYSIKRKLNLLNQTIASNPEQLEAVHFLVDGPNPNAPYIIFGPPGTGKTTTIVESILQLRLHKPGSRILVTAGSNSACDTIAVRICEYFNTNVQLQGMQRSEPKTILRIFSKTVVEKGIKLIDRELLANSNCDKGFHYYPSVKEIRRYGIIVATLCTVGKLVTGDLGHMNFFSHIFIDEAGASTEPEALVGIMGIKTPDCRVILSGDHKQLGPVIKSKRAMDLGLDRSLMERLLARDCYAVEENGNYDRTIQARLRRNYRSHPEIVRLFNHLYYNNELIVVPSSDVNLASKWCKLPNPNFPIIFQAVHGLTEKDTVTPSACNNLEMQVLMWFLQRLLVDGINGCPVNQSDIGIITPYRFQNKLIQYRLNSRGWDKVESGSVETFQGREKQIIIVSLVRSFSGLGFVRNPKRLNVILSRPKSLLILIGNPLTFKHHPDFEFIIEECRLHGTFLRKKRTKNRKQKKNLPLPGPLI